MKRAILVWVAVVLAAATAFSQDTPSNSVLGGNLAINYGNWYVPSTNAVAAGSGQVMNFTTASCSVLVGNKAIFPFSTNAPLTISDGANTETVTPSAVYIDGSICNITAAFANAHGAGIRVTSGTHGLQEAINDSTGATSTVWVTARSGVTSTIILAAAGRTNVGIIDVSGPQQHTYQFTGSSYTEISSGAGPINAGSSTGADLSAQITSTEAGPQCVSTGCPIGVAPGNYSLSTDFQVGNSTSKIPVNLFVNPGAKITVNTADGSNPVCVAEGSSIGGWGGLRGTGGGVASWFLIGPGANISNFIQACSQLGTTQGFRLSGLAIVSNAAATVGGSVIDLKGQYSGTTLDHLVVLSPNSGYAFRMWADDTVAGGGGSVIGMFDDVFAGPTGNTSGKPVVLFQSANQSSRNISESELDNVSVENYSAGQPGVQFQGNAKGANGPKINSIQWNTMHMESGGQATSDGLWLSDAASMFFRNQSFSDPGNVANKFWQTFLNNTRGIEVQGINSSWPTTVQDWINPYGASTMSGTAGDTSLTFAATTALLPGMTAQIMDGQAAAADKTEFINVTGVSGTTVTISPGLAFTHSANTKVYWLPEQFSGPGANGINGSVQSTSGNLTCDSSHNVLFDATANNQKLSTYEGERVWIVPGNVTDIGRFGGVFQVNTGAGCATTPCTVYQFGYTDSACTSQTSTATATAYWKIAKTYDYKLFADNSSDSNINRVSVITGPTVMENGPNPQNLSIAGTWNWSKSWMSRWWLGAQDTLKTTFPADPTCPVGDLCMFAQGNTTTAGQNVAPPNAHFGTDSTTNTQACITQHGVDIACATTDGNLTMQGSATLVGTATKANAVAPIYTYDTCTAANCANLSANQSAQTMVASVPGSDGAVYLFEGVLAQDTLGTSCSSNIVTLQINYVDLDTNHAFTVGVPMQTAATGTVTNVCTTSTSGTLTVCRFTYPISAKSGSVISWDTSSYTATGCSPNWTYTLRPVLKLEYQNQ